MKLYVISLILGLLLLALPVFGHSQVSADGSLYGRVFMDYQGRQIPLKGVFINKVVDCNKLDNKNLCQSQSCVGRGFCPSKPQPYYTKDDGSYNITQDGTPVKNNQPASCNQGDFEIGCGINCGLGTHEFSAYFPDNFNLNNFPSGIDLRKGHFEAATLQDQLSTAPTTVLTDSNGNQYYHLTYTNNSSNNPNLDFKWVPDPLPIAGTITDSQTGRGVGEVTMEVVNDQGARLTTVTSTNGKFSIPSNELFKNSSRYAVRIIAVPSAYKLDTRVVTTSQWSWINVDGGRNAAPPDKSYELQDINNSGCAGPDYDPTKYPHQTGRCNFKIDPIVPTASSSLSNKPTGSVSSTPPLSGTIFPSGGIIFPPGTISSTPGPTATVSITPECVVIDTTGSQVNAISIASQRIDFSSFATLPIKLEGTSGQTNFVLPINVSYSNGACRAFSLAFNYNPNLTPTITTSPTATPDPKLCAKDSNRPNGCACTVSNQSQCQSNRCDPILAVCVSEPFIQTQGGDVHSNQGVQGR